MGHWNSGEKQRRPSRWLPGKKEEEEGTIKKMTCLLLCLQSLFGVFHILHLFSLAPFNIVFRFLQLADTEEPVLNPPDKDAVRLWGIDDVFVVLSESEVQY